MLRRLTFAVLFFPKALVFALGMWTFSPVSWILTGEDKLWKNEKRFFRWPLKES